MGSGFGPNLMTLPDRGRELKGGGEDAHSDEPRWVWRLATFAEPDTDYYVTAGE